MATNQTSSPPVDLETEPSHDERIRAGRYDYLLRGKPEDFVHRHAEREGWPLEPALERWERINHVTRTTKPDPKKIARKPSPAKEDPPAPPNGTRAATAPTKATFKPTDYKLDTVARAERGIFRALMFMADFYEDVRGAEKVLTQIKAEDLSDARHRRMFAAVEAIVDRGELPTPFVVAAEFEASGDLETADWENYLADIIKESCTAANLDADLRIVAEAAAARKDRCCRNQVVAVVRSNSPLSEVRAAVDEWAKSVGAETSQPLSPMHEPPAPMAPPAFASLAGRFVEAVEPLTEADRTSLLMSFLVGAGNLIGEGPYLRVGADRHSPRLYVILEGITSRARKGSAWGFAEQILREVDHSWLPCVQHGVVSGEGLIWHVRDQVVKNEIVVDEGVSDKRLLLLESEFARVLAGMNRESSSLSHVLRQGWDKGRLQTMNKRDPVRATGAYLSVVGHITGDELRARLSDVEVSNGFANRFLIHHVERLKLVPIGDELAGSAIRSLAEELKAVVEFARSVDEMAWGESGGTLWRKIYPHLTADVPGLVGSLLARCEAQAVRLAVLYALLGQSPTIEAEHLKSAFAVLDHWKASVRHIFRDSTGNKLANRVLSCLKAESGRLKRTTLHVKLGGHVDAILLTDALDLLVSMERVRVERVPTGGRPAEWVVLV